MSKYLSFMSKGYDPQTNTVSAFASTETPDRDGEIILSAGWDLDNFMKNPVLLLSHQYYLPPVGKVTKIEKRDNGLWFEAKFADTEAGKEVATLYRDGMMSAFSVGFMPRKMEMSDAAGEPTNDYWKADKVVYTDTELLEISVVSVPANPDAIVDAYEKGLIKSKDFSGLVVKMREPNKFEPHVIEIDPDAAKDIDGDGESGQTKSDSAIAEPLATQDRADTGAITVEKVREIVADALKAKEPEIKTMDKESLKSIISETLEIKDIPRSEKELDRLRKRGIVQI